MKICSVLDYKYQKRQSFNGKRMSCKIKEAFAINRLINTYNNSVTATEDIPFKYSDLPIYIAEKLVQKLLPLLITLDKNSVTQIVKSGHRTVGGYWLRVNEKQKSGYIEFLTLNKNFHKTKIGREALINMAENIHKNAEKRGIESIEWRVSQDNIGAVSLFDRFNPQTINQNNTYYMESVSTEDFKKAIDKYKSSFTKNFFRSV